MSMALSSAGLGTVFTMLVKKSCIKASTPGADAASLAFEAVTAAKADGVDVVLVDTPNGGDYADAEVIAARAGAALLVTRVNQSLIPQASQLARRLQDGGVSLVGSVFNDA